MENKSIKLLSTGIILSGAVLFLLNSCKSIPTHVKPVKPFVLEKYLGKWYEIARIDFKFERNLNNVTATYSMKENSMVKVDNKGYDYKKAEWKNSIGKAKFVKDENEGMLKVSFFGPFYAGYNVIAIDDAYKYALVAGDNYNYLWILSREKTIPENIKQSYLTIARDSGYDVNRLIYVEHDQ